MALAALGLTNIIVLTVGLVCAPFPRAEIAKSADMIDK